MKLIEVVCCKEEFCTEELREYAQHILQIAERKKQFERLFERLEVERVRLKECVLTKEEIEKNKKLKQRYDDNAGSIAVSTLLNLEDYRIRDWKDLEE